MLNRPFMGVPNRATQRVGAGGPAVAPGAPLGNPANGPVAQLLPARKTIQPVVRSTGMDMGEIGTPWKRSF